jgi:hypothetical protein
MNIEPPRKFRAPPVAARRQSMSAGAAGNGSDATA